MAITNTLIKRIQEIKSEGKSFKDANFHKNKKSEIEHVFLPSFEEMSSKFSELITAYNNLKGISEITGVSVEVDLIKSNLSALKDKVIQDEYDKVSVLNLKRTINANYEVLSQIWSKYIQDKTAARAEMLLTLDKLIADMPEKITLQSKKTIFSTAKIGAPNAVKAINDYIETYDNLMNKLNLKDNVSAFLKKLASGERVSIMDMDDDVYNWIKTSGFANKILLKVI